MVSVPCGWQDQRASGAGVCQSQALELTFPVEAQDFGAWWLCPGVPVGEHPADQSISEVVLRRSVGVPVHQCLGAGLAQPLPGHLCVGVGIRRVLPVASLALRAQVARQRLTLGQGPAQQGLYPGRVPHLGAKALVVDIVQAQRVSV